MDLGRLAERGRRRAGPAGRPAGRELRPDRSQQARPDGGPRTGPRPPRTRRGDRGGAALDRAGDRVHQGARPGALPRRGVPGRPGAGVAALGDGDDVAGGAGRAGGPVLVPHHPAGRRPGRRSEQEEWLEVFSATTLPGITVHEVAPGHFSHGRALRQAPTDGAADAALRARSSRAGRTTRRNCASRRASPPTTRASRSACGWRRWSGSPGWPARSGCTPAGMTVAEGARQVRGGHAPGRAGRAVRGPARHVRPHLRPVHLGQAGDPGAARRGTPAVGRRLHPEPVPRRPARPRLPAARPDGHRHQSRLTRRP